MRELTRLELTEQLLYTYQDALCTWRDVDDGTRGFTDSRLLLMSKWWHEGSYAELEATLREMRRRGFDAETYRDTPLRRLYWQVNAWYFAPIKITQVPIRVTLKGGKRVTLVNEQGETQTRPERTYQRSRQCSQQLARLGAEWIGTTIPRLQLPAELFEQIAA